MGSVKEGMAVDTHPRAMKRRLALGIGLLTLVLTFVVSASVGVVSIAPHDIIPTLMGNGSAENYRILFHIRLPRIVTGALTGSTSRWQAASCRGSSKIHWLILASLVSPLGQDWQPCVS